MKYHGFIWITMILVAGMYAPLNVLVPTQSADTIIEHIVINEVYYYNNGWPNDWESSIFVELVNPTSYPVNLVNWSLETSVYGQKWRFAEDISLGSFEMIVVFPDATEDGDFAPFDWVGKRTALPTYVFETATSEGSDQDNPDINNLLDEGGTGDLHFNVTGDFILLKNSTDDLIDAFVWGNASYTSYIAAPVVAAPGHSMERNWTRDLTYIYNIFNCSVAFTESDAAHPGEFAGLMMQTIPKQAPFAIVFTMVAILSLVVFSKKRKKN
ncbi:MAG: lamin tail domain-containing protein [Promethearchaeota archaeon]